MKRLQQAGRVKKSVVYLLLLFAVCIFVTEKTSAQNHPITDPINPFPPDIMVYLGAGSNNPSTKVKDDAYATNTIGFDANVFVAVIKKKNFSFGFNAGGEYFSSNKENHGTLPAAFSVSGSTAESIHDDSGRDVDWGFIIGVAPQVNFFMGKHIIISPMIELGYMSMTNKGFSVIQTTIIDGTLYNFTLLSKTETKTSGLAITPKVRLNYMFTKKIGMWVEGNYTVGPTIKSRINTFLPEPDPDENGQYNIDQMMNGTTNTEVRETKFSTFGVHVGVVFSILDVPDADDYPDMVTKDKPVVGTLQSNPEPGKYTDPSLIAPKDGTIVKTDDLKNPMTLRWTPVIPSPPHDDLIYIIRIYEVKNEQQPVQAVKSNSPVFEKEVKTTQAIWQVPSEYANSKEKRTFVWNVQATNKEGKAYGVNNGMSESFNFKITDKITNDREK